MYSANETGLVQPWWDFKSAIAVPLGHTMVYWARHGVAFPFGRAQEEWQAELYMHGCALLRYGTHEASEDDDFGDYLDEQVASEYEAKAAMQWIADNFEALWD